MKYKSLYGIKVYHLYHLWQIRTIVNDSLRMDENVGNDSNLFVGRRKCRSSSEGT